MCALGSSPVISHLCHLPAVELTHSHQASSLFYKSLVVISPSHVYGEYEEWPCLCCPGMLASTERALHTWDRPQRSTLQLLSCVPKCAIFHRASCWPCWPFGSVTTYRSLANSWAFRRPAPGWAGRAHQKAEVWFNTWNMSEQRPVSLVFTAKAAKHAQWAGMTASLSRARFRSLWEVRSKWDALKASQDAHSGWSASKSYTLIWVNSELSHIACKLMGIRVRGHFKELW